MNILTFDIEEWGLAKSGGYGSTQLYSEYDSYLDKILDFLDERGIKGTFFCTGMMAAEFPYIVKRIQNRGHEIGCHSFNHLWLNKMLPDEVYEDTRISIEALEQCTGSKILSYRAPAFSIGKENKWAFDILAQCGITRDASIYPAERDFGGFADFGQKQPAKVCTETAIIKEFPICTSSFFGRELAYSGGGYFRFMPLRVVQNEMAKANYCMTYFHIGDLIPESSCIMNKEDFERYYKIPGSLKNRYVRYLKNNIGKKRAFAKLMELIKTEEFISVDKADQIIEWEQAPSVVL